MMTTPIASLRLNARGLAAAGALLLSGVAIAAAAGPAWADTINTADRAHYIVFAGGSGDESSINASDEDSRRATSLRTGNGGLLYVRQAGTAYVIRDAATLQRVQQVLEPQRQLGRRQAALGDQQAALGRQQDALGAQQEQLGALMENARVSELPELARKQEELGRGQARLGQQQAALGSQQGALGAKQARLSRIAEANLAAIVRDAVQRGVAQRVG